MGLLFDYPADCPLILRQGATFRLSDLLKDSETVSPLDMTDCFAVAEIWESYEDTAPLVRWNTNSADTTRTAGAAITLGGAAGTIVIDLSDEATALLPRLDKPAHWYCVLTWPDGDSTWLYEGQVKIVQKKERTT